MVVVITGPESSGKSTLSKQLALDLGAKLIDEYARTFLSTPDYSFEDLEVIAHEQLRLIAKAKKNNSKDQLVISDTGDLVLEIWFEEKFNRLPAQWESLKKAAIPDLYFLCSADIPWESDKLRENPTDRDRLFQIYLQKLNAYGAEYYVMTGSEDERIAKAKKVMAKKKAAL